jgi:THO complex subunit 4
MSGRLDQSLDTIIDGQKKAKREQRRRQGKPGRPAGKVTSAPVGGVKKSTRPVKTTLKGAATGPSAPQRDSTIVVSGLVSNFPSFVLHWKLTNSSQPHDVNEAQIKVC